MEAARKAQPFVIYLFIQSAFFLVQYFLLSPTAQLLTHDYYTECLRSVRFSYWVAGTFLLQLRRLDNEKVALGGILCFGRKRLNYGDPDDLRMRYWVELEGDFVLWV